MIQALLHDIVLQKQDERPICAVVGCDDVCNKKGNRGNIQRYQKFCGYHANLHKIDKGYIPTPSRRRLNKVRGVCTVGGCNLPQTPAYRSSNNSPVYSPLCNSHERDRELGFLDKKKECSVCGWDEGRVDYHRIVPGKHGGSYLKGNVLMLCPNCHRLEHSQVVK